MHQQLASINAEPARSRKYRFSWHEKWRRDEDELGSELCETSTPAGGGSPREREHAPADNNLLFCTDICKYMFCLFFSQPFLYLSGHACLGWSVRNLVIAPPCIQKVDCRSRESITLQSTTACNRAVREYPTIHTSLPVVVRPNHHSGGSSKVPVDKRGRLVFVIVHVNECGCHPPTGDGRLKIQYDT